MFTFNVRFREYIGFPNISPKEMKTAPAGTGAIWK
jgi:hypothetical protein